MTSLNQKDREAESKIERRLAEIERQLLKVPSRWKLPEDLQLLQIIGGQTSNGIPVIKYTASDPSFTRLYDPDVDTTYPDGSGNAWLIVNGFRRRVLARHDFGGDTDYLMGASPVGGWLYAVRGTKSIAVASGADMGKPMLFYQVGWAL